MEDKKVTCRYCWHEMQPDEKTCVSVYVEGHWNSQQPVNYRCECGAESPIADGMDAAYIAANKRPENKPLSREQIMGMPGDDAVWYIHKYGGSLNVICAKGAAYHYADYENKDTGNCAIYFAAKPTPADIEAARKKADK